LSGLRLSAGISIPAQGGEGRRRLCESDSEERAKGKYNLSMVAVQTIIPPKKLAAFCKRWKVVEFALFGSAVRDDFSSRSDIDALVSFAPQSDWGLFDHIQMKQELKELFGRDVDLVTRRALEQSRNALLRSEILNTAKVLYSEREAAHVQTPG
jgi:predicted nucleotidyltransferase